MVPITQYFGRVTGSFISSDLQWTQQWNKLLITIMKIIILQCEGVQPSESHSTKKLDTFLELIVLHYIKIFVLTSRLICGLQGIISI